MDGREPVDLPDTWAEARAVFRVMCEDAAADSAAIARCQDSERLAFDGYPADSHGLAADAALCSRLLRFSYQWVAGAEFTGLGLPPLFPPRRLKSGSTGSRSYGYSSSRLSRSYPQGHRTTSYGYHGRAQRTHYYVFWSPNRFGHGRSSHDGGCSSGSSADSGCDWELAPEEEMFRDDITEAMINPEVHGQEPYTVTIYSVSSLGLSQSRICPPGSGDWEAPGQQDLFVTLVPLEEVSEPPWLTLTVLVLFCCFWGPVVFCCIARYRRGQRRRVPAPQAGDVSYVQEVKVAPLCFQAIPVSGASVAGGLPVSGCIPNYAPAPLCLQTNPVPGACVAGGIPNYANRGSVESASSSEPVLPGAIPNRASGLVPAATVGVPIAGEHPFGPIA